MEALREVIMGCLAEYFDEEEEDPCGCGGPDQCGDVEELEAIMVAMIKSLKERIDAQDKRIAELEKRGQIQYIPVSYPAPDTSAPWTQSFSPIFTCKI